MASYPTEFSKEELLKCSGELFGPGNAKLPHPMLMIDRITEISEDSEPDGKGML